MRSTLFFLPLALIIPAAVFIAGSASADAVVLKRALPTDANTGPNLIDNSGCERVEDGRVVGAGAWQAGYEIDEQVTHSGKRAVRISADDPEVQYGIAFTVELNQQRPAPLLASVWSRARDVEGTPNSGYSLWLDLTFTDGTNLWGQNIPFECGTHDWQQRSLPLAPTKPIRSVLVYGLFRGKTGTVWFDDFSLTQLDLAEGATSFNGVPVVVERPRLHPTEIIELPVGEGLTLRLDAATGALVGPDGAVGGIFWRDVQAGSDFRQPRGSVVRDGADARLRARDQELGLEIETRFSPRGECVEISGQVRDLTGGDRAVSVYLALPWDATGGRWHEDQRRSQEIADAMTWENAVSVGAGPNGLASRYPLACVTTDTVGAAIAVPLDRPRIAELAYDGASRELYAALHLGLSSETARFPSSADFALAIFPVDPAWGFRDALARYYAAYPECFAKRTQREGIWMPFTDVSTVQGWEDFGFAFHEGNNNVAFDDEADIASYVYCEPVSYWMRMAPEVPRTRAAAIEMMRAQAAQGNQDALATISSALHDARGEIVVDCIDAPWCDGAMFTNNPSPHLFDDHADLIVQGRLVSERLWRAFEHAEQLGNWNAYENGFTFEPDAGRDGGGAIRCTAEGPGQRHGAAQTVNINQPEARNLVIHGWSRAEGLQAAEGGDWCLYVDITYDNGENLWGQKASFDPTVAGWQQAETVIEVTRPVRTAAVYALLRGNVTGTVYFDDLFLGEEGGAMNLLHNASFEPTRPGELDGIYIDSSEMAAGMPNFRREHWRYSTIPLTFTREGAICQLEIFNSVEFARSLAEPLHERGCTLFANSTPSRFPWLAAWLDVMGTETNWGPGGVYTPNSDEVMNYRRAICYQRPYLLLLNTVYDDFRPEWVELYFKRSIAYGIFPSFFSHNASDDPYWQRPNLYNRDRPLFQRYIPVCATLSRAGWEPVTLARADTPTVYVERFGPGADGRVYLTVFNDAQAPCTATLNLGMKALGITRPSVREVLPEAGATIEVTPTGSFAVELAAEDLRVVEVVQGP